MFAVYLFDGQKMNGRREFHAPPARDFSSFPNGDDARPSPPVFAGFVDDAVCAECHAEISAMYARSGMSRSWRSVDDAFSETRFAHPDFSGANFVDDPKNGYRYRAFEDGGRVVQEETLLDPTLSPGHALRRDARYVVGSGNHAQAFLTEHNGFLTAMPLNWFTDDERWGLNPGYERRNLRFDRPVLPGCIGCHGSSAHIAAGSSHRYTEPIADGISCQRCHGAGASHVAFWRENKAIEPAAAAPNVADTIVNPAKLTPPRGNDVCLQCHLMGDVSLELPGEHEFSFHPGENLQVHRIDLLMKSDRPETFGVASHGARLMQSRCFLESGDQLTCFHCHNPHQAISEAPPSSFNARCVACHAPESCGREAAPEIKTLADGCVTCHMPRRQTREGQHLVFTDHLIRVPIEGASGEAWEILDVEPISADAELELVSAWPDRSVDVRRLGSAYILLHETMPPQLPAVRRGVALLLNEARRDRLDAAAGYWLGSGLISLGRPADAIPILARVVRDQPHNLQARFRLGIAYDASKRHAEAIREYEQILNAAEDALDPYPPLVRLYLQQGRFDRAVSLLEQRHRLHATAESYSQLAVALHAAGDPPQQCLPLIQKALELDPRYLNAHLTEAEFRLAMQQPKLARASFLRVLKIDSQNARARAALETMKESHDQAD